MAKKNFFQSILPYAAGALGSGISSQFSALAPFQAAIGAGAGALSDTKNPFGGAAAGFAGSGVGSTLAGGLKGAFTGAPGTSAFDNFGSGAMSGLQSFGGSIPGFGGVGTSNPTGAFAKFFAPSAASTLQNGSKYFTPATGGGYNPTGLSLPSSTIGASAAPTFGNTSAVGGTPTGASSSSAGGPMNMFKALIPGAAVAGLGNLLAPTPAPPDYSGIMDQFKNQIQTGGDPAARAAAQSQFMSTLNQPNGASAEGAVANARLINEREKAAAAKQITDQFSANNGSTTGNSAYNDAITKSNAAYDQNYNATAQQAQFQADQLQAQQKTAAAQALAGMDDTQLQYYAGLTGLSVQQIQDKFQLDAGRAQSLANIATQAGALLMEKGLGLGGAK